MRVVSRLGSLCLVWALAGFRIAVNIAKLPELLGR
jgi:hypothetical protein